MLGLVIWLATLGLFKNPAVVAVALGLGNAALLVGGWAITSYTRYETAGRALTLLACLVMPLNLWFYHANNLITLDGHLWVAALVCCVLYAASAMVLRDAIFVYVLAGGVAMTGLLMLADMGKFWEVAAPATLLVVLGLICIHTERAFPDTDGPFSRRSFGLGFFWSGHALLAAGLLLLLGAQIAGDWLYKPFFESIYQHWRLGPPAVVAERWGQLLALALVLAGTYAYIYSDLAVRRVGMYIFLAVFTLLWAEVLVIELFALKVTTEAAIVALALTALAVNLIAPSATRWQQGLPSGQRGVSGVVNQAAGARRVAVGPAAKHAAGDTRRSAASPRNIQAFERCLASSWRRTVQHRLVLRGCNAVNGRGLLHRRTPLSAEHTLAVDNLLFWHGDSHAGRRSRPALDSGREDLG